MEPEFVLRHPWQKAEQGRARKGESEQAREGYTHFYDNPTPAIMNSPPRHWHQSIHEHRAFEN